MDVLEEKKENEMAAPIETEQTQENTVVQDSEDAVDTSYLLDALSENDQDVANNQKTIEYSRTTGKPVPDYYSQYKSTISGTGTELDGQNVFDVANKKEATPKEIFNLWDTIISILDGFRAAGINIAITGGELVTGALDNTISAIERSVGVDPEQSKRELRENVKKVADFLGGEEMMESKSYSGAIAGTLANIYAGGAITKGIKAPVVAKSLAKTNAGRKVITGFIGLMKEMTAIGTAFPENQKNISEFIESTFGIPTPEFLKKKEDDPELLKRLKNSMDAPAAALITKGVSKLAKRVFAPRSAIIEKGVAAVEKAEDAAIKSGKTGEEFAKVMQETLGNRLKAFSQKEIATIIQRAEEQGIVPKDSLKDANREVMENAAIKIVQLNRAAESVGVKAREALYKHSVGDMNDKDAKDVALSLWNDMMEKVSTTKESLSSSGQVEALASQSEALRIANKAISFVSENADRLDYREMLEIMSKVNNPSSAAAFFDAVTGRVAQGKVSDILNKLAFIEQDMYLMSGASRVKDAASTFGHLMLQTAETAVAGMVVHPIRAGLKKVAKMARNPRATEAGKEALTTFTSPQDMVYFGEALDMLHGTFSMIANGVYTAARKSLEKAKILKASGETAFQKAVRQSVDANQSRIHLTREVQTNVFSTNSKLGQMMNKILNHGGIWAAEKIDDFNQAIAYRAHLERNVGIMARKQQALNGWTKAETNAFAKKMLKESEKVEINPNKAYDFMNAFTVEGQLEAAVKRSASEASVTTFRAPLTPDTWEANFYKFVNDTDYVKQAARVLFPFQKTSLQIAANEFLRKRSGLFSVPYLKTQFAQGGRATEEALARVAMGVGIQGTAIGLMLNDKLTGPRPQNPGEAALWESEGRQEYSYNTENGWVSFKDAAGPLGPMLVGSTIIADRIRRINEMVDGDSEEEWSEYMAAFPSILAEASLSETVIGNWLEAVERGDVTYMNQFGRSVATLGPGIVRELTQWEENQQTTLSLLDEFENKLGIDTSVDKLDMFGLPIKAKNKWRFGYKYSEAEENLVTDTMLYYGAFVEPPRKTATYKDVKLELDKGEVYQWQQIMAEKDAFGKMLTFITSSDFKKASEAKRDFSGEYQDSRTTLLKKKYNSIKQEALEELVNRNVDVYNKYIGTKTKESLVPSTSGIYESRIPTMPAK